LPLLAEYKKSLKLLEVEELFDLLLYRPLAFIFVKGMARTRVTPNQLTLASMIFGFFGGAMYAVGTANAYAAGAVLYLIYNVLDCSDGQLARLKHSGSLIGRILDGIADYIAALAAYVGIGWGFARNSSNPAAMLALTVLAGLGNAVQAGLLDYYRNRFLDVVLERPHVLDKGIDEFRDEYNRMKKAKEKLFDRTVIRIYLAYCAVQKQFIGERLPADSPKVDAKKFYARNRVLIHCWTYLGPTTQWTLLIICSFLNRLDIYLVGVGIIGSVLAAILFFIQKRTDLRLAASNA
jgi:hypothetical protein